MASPDKIKLFLHPHGSSAGHFLQVDQGTTFLDLAKDAFDYPRNRVTFQIAKRTHVGKQATDTCVLFNIALEQPVVDPGQPIQYVLSKSKQRGGGAIAEEDESEAGSKRKRGGDGEDDDEE